MPVRLLTDAERGRFPASDEDIIHLSPTRYGHVNPYGRYRFDLGGDPGNGQDRTHHDPQPRLPSTI